MEQSSTSTGLVLSFIPASVQLFLSHYVCASERQRNGSSVSTAQWNERLWKHIWGFLLRDVYLQQKRATPSAWSVLLASPQPGKIPWLKHYLPMYAHSEAARVNFTEYALMNLSVSFSLSRHAGAQTAITPAGNASGKRSLSFLINLLRESCSQDKKLFQSTLGVVYVLCRYIFPVDAAMTRADACKDYLKLSTHCRHAQDIRPLDRYLDFAEKLATTLPDLQRDETSYSMVSRKSADMLWRLREFAEISSSHAIQEKKALAFLPLTFPRNQNQVNQNHTTGSPCQNISQTMPTSAESTQVLFGVRTSSLVRNQQRHTSASLVKDRREVTNPKQESSNLVGGGVSSPWHHALEAQSAVSLVVCGPKFGLYQNKLPFLTMLSKEYHQQLEHDKRLSFKTLSFIHELATLLEEIELVALNAKHGTSETPACLNDEVAQAVCAAALRKVKEFRKLFFTYCHNEPSFMNLWRFLLPWRNALNTLQCYLAYVLAASSAPVGHNNTQRSSFPPTSGCLQRALALCTGFSKSPLKFSRTRTQSIKRDSATTPISRASLALYIANSALAAVQAYLEDYWEGCMRGTASEVTRAALTEELPKPLKDVPDLIVEIAKLTSWKARVLGQEQPRSVETSLVHSTPRELNVDVPKLEPEDSSKQPQQVLFSVDVTSCLRSCNPDNNAITATPSKVKAPTATFQLPELPFSFKLHPWTCTYDTLPSILRKTSDAVVAQGLPHVLQLKDVHTATDVDDTLRRLCRDALKLRCEALREEVSHHLLTNHAFSPFIQLLELIEEFVLLIRPHPVIPLFLNTLPLWSSPTLPDASPMNSGDPPFLFHYDSSVSNYDGVTQQFYDILTSWSTQQSSSDISPLMTRSRRLFREKEHCCSSTTLLFTIVPPLSADPDICTPSSPVYAPNLVLRDTYLQSLLPCAVLNEALRPLFDLHVHFHHVQKELREQTLHLWKTRQRNRHVHSVNVSLAMTWFRLHHVIGALRFWLHITVLEPLWHNGLPFQAVRPTLMSPAPSITAACHDLIVCLQTIHARVRCIYPHLRAYLHLLYQLLITKMPYDAYHDATSSFLHHVASLPMYNERHILTLEDMLLFFT